MTSTGKIALITGGSRGLGRNMAMKIAASGHDVILTYRSQKEEADAVVAEIKSLGRKAVALQLDTAVVSSFGAFADQVKAVLTSEFHTEGFHYLINNAGVGLHTPVGSATEEQFDTLMNIHLKGVIFLTQQLLPILQDGGGIVNISTGLARFTLPGYAVYAAMKGGMEVYTRYEAKELGVRGIRANIVAPGAIETDFGGGAVRDIKEVNQAVASMIALGRAGVPEDIGGVVAFLCTEDARWINGQRIEVSGGQIL